MEAGTGTLLPTLAAGVAAAKDGDTIRLAPGTYYECAVLPQRDLVLEGVDGRTILSDRTCEGKALLVARGDNLTVRGLTLARARVPDRNGAGIRLEAQGLVLQRVRFDNNEVGVLAGQDGPGTLLVQECSFTGGGVAGDRATAALMVGRLALLRVEGSRFEQGRGGQIASAAARTEVKGSTLVAGLEPGAGPAVHASGDLLMEDDAITLGPHAPARPAAVVATGAGAALHRVRLHNTTGQPAALLLDWTGGTPDLVANTVEPGDVPSTSDGRLRHRAGEVARGIKAQLRSTAGDAKRAVLGVLGR